MRIHLVRARCLTWAAVAALALALPFPCASVSGAQAPLLAGTLPSVLGAIQQGETRPVDIVICLDTSGSMESLLDSARARVWDVVNELGRLTPTPEIRLGLLSYGTDLGTEEDGWVVLKSDLSDDLDTVYGQLMELTTAGGEEYVGRVLHTAVDTMNWSTHPDALKIIFLAGNESADQAEDTYSFRDAAKFAKDDGIIINALYAGNREQAIVENWPEVARQGGGNFSAIDPLLGTIQIATPQDALLLDLNTQLIPTYLPYGPRGKDGLANQVAQDGNASRLGVQSCSSRITAKGSALYTNAEWDLVDATLKGEFQWDALRDEDLPAEMATMNRGERIAHVATKRAAREAVQKKIQKVSLERENHIQAVLAKERGKNDEGLGDAMRKAIRGQAIANGFTCKGC